MKTIKYNNNSVILELEPSRCKGSTITTSEIFDTWSPIIIIWLELRLMACENKFIGAKDQIHSINEHCVEYIQNGIIRQYKFGTVETLNSAIAKFKNKNYKLTAEEAEQTLKALLWCNDHEDKDEIAFQLVIDSLFDIYRTCHLSR